MHDAMNHRGDGASRAFLQPLLEKTRKGWSLPREFYVSPEIFHLDMERLFSRSWIFATHSCEAAKPGDFVTLEVGENPLLIVRGEDGALRGFYNVCRHRGSRVLTEACGTAKRMVCPYHQWAYDLKGSLRSAKLMGEDFECARFSLKPIHVEEVAGLVFICLGETAPDFSGAAAAYGPQLEPHGLKDARVIVRHKYRVNANWKLLLENNRECYHCRGAHPEFCLSNYDLGMPGDTRASDEHRAIWESQLAHWKAIGLNPQEINFPGGDFYRVSRLPLKPGFVTETLDGKRAAPLLGSLRDENTGSLRMIGLPNLWAHANCDYAMTTRVLPLGPLHSDVEVAFLVRSDAQPGGDCDLDRVADVWKTTSEQDWELCENNQRGIRSTAYESGPYSTVTENSVSSFIEWYLKLLNA